MRQSDGPLRGAILRSIATKYLPANRTSPVLALVRVYG